MSRERALQGESAVGTVKSLILLSCTFKCLFSAGQSRHKIPPGFYCFTFCTSFLCNCIYNYRKDRIIHHFAQTLSPAVIHCMMSTLSYYYFFIHHTLSLFFIHSGISVLTFPVFKFLLSSNTASESEVASQAWTRDCCSMGQDIC